MYPIGILVYLLVWYRLDADNIGVDAQQDKNPYLVGHWNALYPPDQVQDQSITVQVSEEHINTLCYGCHRHSSQNAKITISELDLTALRIEYIKQQILKKLRLKEPPTGVMPLSKLPKPLSEGDEIVPRSNNGQRAEPDDFYAKTTQAILFPIEGAHECTPIRSPSACFPFQLSGDIEWQDVSAAELWVYKRKDTFDSHNQTFVVSDIAHWDIKHSFTKMKPIAIHETSTIEGWMRIDLAWPVRDWLHYEQYKHALNIACKTCGMDSSESPVSQKPEHKPFLVIYTYSHPAPPFPSHPPSKYQKRKKRNINCSKGAKECCREQLYVSFKDIGWDDWIIFPPGYHAYFCRGSCTSAAAVTLSGSHYNSVIRKLLYQGVSDSLRLELLPCCTATQFLPLQLLYMDNNNTITQKTLPNMIVESCGCM